MIKKRFALLSTLCLLFFTCKQSPIFYDISLEVEPIDPRIKGTPTNIVRIGDSLYVASRFGGAIYEYKDSDWLVLPESPGKIIELAATNGALYALTGTPGSLGLQKLPTGSSSWIPIGTGGKNVQTIYGAGDYLFAGAIDNPSANPPTCSILYVKDDGASLTSLQSGTSLLRGAAYDGTSYYLATNGSGILVAIDSGGAITIPAPMAAASTLPMATSNSPLATPASMAAASTLPVATSNSSLATLASMAAISNSSVATSNSPLATLASMAAISNSSVATSNSPLATPASMADASTLPVATSNSSLATSNSPVATYNSPVATYNPGVVTYTLPVVTSSSPVTTSTSSVATYNPSVVTYTLPVVTPSSPVTTPTSSVATGNSTVVTYTSDVVTYNPTVAIFASSVVTYNPTVSTPASMADVDTLPVAIPNLPAVASTYGVLQQQQAENPHKDIVGIIEVGGKIAAVSRDGYILYGDADGFVAKKAQGVSYFTGALAMWEKGADKLLLLGIQGGTNSTAHGYREILLAADGNLDMATLSLRRPGEEAPSSVEPSSEKDNRYVVTIGKHPLSSIIQVSDKILFAATTQYGLWSYKYREHEGMSVWNAED